MNFIDKVINMNNKEAVINRLEAIRVDVKQKAEETSNEELSREYAVDVLAITTAINLLLE